MMYTQKTLVLWAASFVALLPSTLLAQTANTDPDSKAILQKLEKMDQGLQESLRSISQDIGNVKKDINTLQGEGLTQRVEQGKSNSRIEALESQVKTLRNELDNLLKRTNVEPPLGTSSTDKQQPGPANRVALSPPNPTGRVVLVNLYPEELFFIVNQKTHRVPANATVPLEAIPAGTLSYEVISPTWGQRARATTTLATNETFTLTAR